LEFRQVLRRHKEYIQSNKTSLFFVTTNVHENEHHRVSQHVTLVNLLVHKKQRFNILEVECSMLRNLALNLHQDSLLLTSNNKDPINYAHVELKEEETVHQLKEPMDIE